MAINPVTTNRVTGLASGLDIDTLVKNMLQVDQSRLDRQNQTTTKLQWKADALREVNSLLRTFRESNLSVLSPDTNMLSASAYSSFDVTMLTETNAVTVSAGSSAIAGKVTINSITQLAEAAQATSSDVFSTEISKDTALKDLSFNNALTFDVDGNISFSINDVDFTFSQDTLLNDMMSKINASDAGVKISYSSLKDGFTITSKTTGSASEIKIVNTAGNAFSATNSAFGIAEGTINGQDAKLNIEGYDVVKSSNTFTIDGITYTLKNESATSIDFMVDKNVDATIDKISKFVDSYNELIGKLQDKIGEDVYRAYTPLTDVQKDEMSESEIEKWEKQAMSGLLHNDSGISGLLAKVRSALYTKVEGTGMSLSDIGLATGNYGDGAKITLNKDKLRKALENNPDAVTSLFTQTSDSADKATKFNESGLMVRISNAFLDYTEQATDVSLSFLEEQISDSKDRVEILEDKMSDREESLYLRFSAMESALAKLNSQSGWLASMFSSTNS
jgi:flagellar hook-associated protein 2